MARRRFNVSMHIDGQGPSILDHFECDNHGELLHMIQQSVGSAIDFIAYLNRAKNCFFPLRHFDFNTLPENLELHVATAGPSNRTPIKTPQMPVAQVDRTISLKARVIQVLREYFLPYYTSGQMTKEQIVAGCSSVSSQFMRNMGLSEFEQQSDHRELTEREQASIHELVIEYVSLSRPSDTRSQSRLRHSEREQASIFQPVTDYVPLSRPSDTRLQTPPASLSPGREVSSDRVLFTSVSYAMGGEFPRLPRHIQQQGPHVTLASPNNPDPKVDINVMGSVRWGEIVTLHWTLAYGPQRSVLNLDSLYTGSLATTYQLNETSLFLCLRPGSLVCGWEYYVHLTATDMNGMSGYAMVTFVLPTSSRSVPPRQGHFADAGVGMDQGLTPGRGVMGPSSNNFETPSLKDPKTSLPSQALKARKDNGPLPLEAAPPLAEPTLGMSPRKTYHESLKEFIETQVQPLYSLSSNPSISEEHFRVVVKDVARTFWFSHPPDQILTEDIKRSIVKDVKYGITLAKTSSKTK